MDQLVEALNGKVTDHHRFLLKLHLNNIAYLADQVQEIDEQIQKLMIPFQKEESLIQTIPGISKISATAIFSEIGADIHSSLLKLILHHGLEYVLETMRAPESRGAGGSEKAINTSRQF